MNGLQLSKEETLKKNQKVSILLQMLIKTKFVAECGIRESKTRHCVTKSIGVGVKEAYNAIEINVFSGFPKPREDNPPVIQLISHIKPVLSISYKNPTGGDCVTPIHHVGTRGKEKNYYSHY